MKYKNQGAFSIIIAIGLVLVMTFLVLYVLEYIIPYSKNVKGIENASKAFYQAESAIEEALYSFKTRTNITDEDGVAFPGTAVGYTFQTYSSGTIIPPVGEGNSEFDSNFNIIAAGNPIQLEVGGLSPSDWNSIRFIFQTPLIGGSRGNLRGGTGAIINWQLSGYSDTLNADGSSVLADDFPVSGILNRNIFHPGNSNSLGIAYEVGKSLDGTNENFDDFYGNNCLGVNSCILKMSVINELKITGSKTIPYLEYKIDFGSHNVPLRFSRIKAKGKSYGFQKSLEARVPQQTTNEAFDFTVFQ